MCLQDEETYGHWAVWLSQFLVFAREELRQRDEIVVALSHFLTVDGNHVVVHPIVNHLVSLACHGLCYLTFMMREYQVHTTSMYIEMVT